MTERILDDPQGLRQLDSLHMFDALYGLPEQCSRAWELGLALPVTARGEIRQVMVTGLGGSAIGGDLLRVFAGQRLPVPVTVNRDYVLPKFVGPQTLVFATSYSGNTEETLSAYQQAREKGAQIVALTTGGKLKEMADRDGVPVITVPGGISPRAATGYLFIPTLAVLQKLGLLEPVDAQVSELSRHLQTMREKLKPEIPQTENLSKQIAVNFFRHIPVIWGAAGTSEVVAQRWKGQVNENAKAPAYWNVFPELNHNELVGFQEPKELLRQLYIVILRDPHDHPRVQKRYTITREIMGQAVAGITEVAASGEGDLARTYSLIYTGDYASVYLAILNNIDPGPVNVIDFLKARLAEQ